MATAVETRTGTSATLSILLAIGGIVMAFSGAPIWALLAHIGAVVLGAVGLVMAASPKVTGGIMSITAIVLAVLGVGLDMLVLLGKIVF